MRTLFLHIVVFCLIFASAEGAADSFLEGLPHGDELSHQEDFGHSIEVHSDGSPEGDFVDEHCGHCCHGHSAGITVFSAALSGPPMVAGHDPKPSTQMCRLAQPPPTPPPNE